jgi:hypothetical protein
MDGQMNKNTTTVLMGLTVFAVAALSPIVLGRGFLPWAPAEQEKISGQVSCQSGRPVVGIWVAQVTGVGMFANWTSDNTNPSTAGYYATIPEGMAYELHVGCGGTPQRWSMSGSSSTTTAVSVTLRCHDAEGDPAYGTCS